MSDVERYIAFLTRVLAEDEQWALAASQTEATGTATGEHWQWECSNCDTIITPDPVLNEFVECPECESVGVSLRSVETYTYAITDASYSSLPAFIINAEEVPTVIGGYLLRQSTTRTLARTAALGKLIRRLTDLCAGDIASVAYLHDALVDVIKTLVEVYAEDWKHAPENQKR